MKNLKLLLFSITLVSTLSLQSCFYTVDDSPRRYSPYEPVYMSRQQLENSIKMSGPKNMEKAGKIFAPDLKLILF